VSPYEKFDWSLVKPENRLRLYSVVTSQTTLDRHYPSQWGRQDESVIPYVKAAQAYGITPAFFSSVYNLDGAKFMHAQTASLTEMFFPVRMYDTPTIQPGFLQQMNTYAATLGGKKPLVYLCDEPSTHGALQACIDAVKVVRTNFPLADILVTDVFRQDLYDAGVRHFSPPLNYITKSAAGVDLPPPSAYASVRVSPYISNMSAMGQAAYGVSPPDFALDREPVYARAFATVALAVLPELDNLLYYHTMAVLPSSTLTESIFRENVNMDGILFYADTTQNLPMPSARMYENAEGLIDGSLIKELLSRSEHRAWILGRLAVIAPSQFNWDRNYQTYVNLRAEMVARLKP
jgi:hypothetical protein